VSFRKGEIVSSVSVYRLLGSSIDMWVCRIALTYCVAPHIISAITT
jgi:hypothetical protein